MDIQKILNKLRITELNEMQSATHVLQHGV